MANIKNFGLIGVASDVQFGKAGPRVVNASGAFQFKDAAGTAFADVTAKELTATALNASLGKIVAVGADGKLVANALNAADLATDAEVTAAVAAEAALREAADEALQDNIDAEATARGAADTVLQGNIDTLEDTVTQNKADLEEALSDETAARIAADALKLNLTGGTLTGDLILSSTPTNSALGAVSKGYVDSLAGGLSWQEAVDGIGASNPGTATTGDRFINTTDGKIYTATATNTWDAGVTPADGWAAFSTIDETGYVFSGTVWTQFTGTGQITAGLGLKKTGNRLDVELSGTGGMTFTPDELDEGSVLALKLDGATLSMGASGVRVAAAVISELSAATSDIVDIKADIESLAGDIEAHADAEEAARDAAILVETNRALAAESDLADDIAAEATARGNADTALQGEIDAIETGAGLNSDGTFTAPTGTTYLAAAASLKNADVLLDAAIKAVADDVAALGEGSITALQDEVDAIESAMGINADGTAPGFFESNYLVEFSNHQAAIAQLDLVIYQNNEGLVAGRDSDRASVGLDNETGALPSFAATNYLTSITAVTGGLTALDTAIKTVADNVATANGNVSGLQTEVDLIEEALGINNDGTLQAWAETNFLDESESLRGAVLALDVELGRQKSIDTDLAFYLGLVDGELPDLSETAYLTAAGSAFAGLVLLDTALDNLSSTSGQNFLDLYETIGLTSEGNMPNWTGTNYLTDASSIADGMFDLDVALKALADGAVAGARTSISVTGVGLAYNNTTGVISSNATSSGTTEGTLVSRGVGGVVEVGGFSSGDASVQALQVRGAYPYAIPYADDQGQLVWSENYLTVDTGANALQMGNLQIKTSAVPAAAADLTNKAYVDDAIAAAVGEAAVNTAHAVTATFSGADAVIGTVNGFVHRIKVYITAAAGTGADVQVGTVAVNNQLVTTADVDSGVVGMYIIEVGQNYATDTALSVFVGNAGVSGRIVVEYI